VGAPEDIVASVSAAQVERLVTTLRRGGRRGSARAAAAERARDELVAMGGEAVPALVESLETIGEPAAIALGRIGPPALPALSAALGSGTVERRRLAARALEVSGLPEGVFVLRETLSDPEPGVRRAARTALEGLARVWTRRLSDGVQRDAAMHALAAAGESAVWALAHVLHDRLVGIFAARVLSEIGEDAVRPVLLVFVQACRDPGHGRWDTSFSCAASALADIGAAALDPVVGLYRDRHEMPAVRAGAVYILGRMGSMARPFVLEALEDADPAVREAAAAALAA
jgi:HEAT repeat protein